jgi:hypothetical protein
MKRALAAAWGAIVRPKASPIGEGEAPWREYCEMRRDLTRLELQAERDARRGPRTD